MDNFTVSSIGRIQVTDSGYRILLHPQYTPALKGLDGFGHIQILWWFSACDDAASRATLREPSPYRHSPEELGTFATRSPLRPNPIALSCAEVLRIDEAAGVVEIAYTDADDGTPVLDLKPYTPSLDRVEHPRLPDWCAHWPRCLEASGDFDWAAEFNF